MDVFWGNYLEDYVNEPFYWWQPKGFTVSAGNLPEIRRKLIELQRFEGKRWRSVQARYARVLQKHGLFDP